MPRVAEVFAGGGISEFAAKSIVNEATGLTAKQAGQLDTKLAARVAGLTPRKAGNLARQYAIGIDAAAAYERAKANRKDRFVSMFPDRDGVGVLQIRGPAEQLLSVYKSLESVAATAKAAGDTRTRATQDRVCRQPGCDCRISQFDHIVSYLDGGLTTLDNGQGLCGRSHTLKHLPGWRITADKRGDIAWQTPTGHRYDSKRPPVFEYRSDIGHLRQ